MGCYVEEINKKHLRFDIVPLKKRNKDV